MNHQMFITLACIGLLVLPAGTADPPIVEETKDSAIDFIVSQLHNSSLPEHEKGIVIDVLTCLKGPINTDAVTCIVGALPDPGIICFFGSDWMDFTSGVSAPPLNSIVPFVDKLRQNITEDALSGVVNIENARFRAALNGVGVKLEYRSFAIALAANEECAQMTDYVRFTPMDGQPSSPYAGNPAEFAIYWATWFRQI